jgi:hypothetical protein
MILENLAVIYDGLERERIDRFHAPGRHVGIDIDVFFHELQALRFSMLLRLRHFCRNLVLQSEANTQTVGQGGGPRHEDNETCDESDTAAYDKLFP